MVADLGHPLRVSGQSDATVECHELSARVSKSPAGDNGATHSSDIFETRRRDDRKAYEEDVSLRVRERSKATMG